MVEQGAIVKIILKDGFVRAVEESNIEERKMDLVPLFVPSCVRQLDDVKVYASQDYTFHRLIPLGFVGASL